MDDPPPKPPRKRQKSQRCPSSPTSRPESKEQDAGHSEKMLEISDNLEQLLETDGVLSDDIPLEEKAESFGINTLNLEFQADDGTLKEVSVSDSSKPISPCETTIVDKDPESFLVVEQAMLASSAHCMPGSSAITSCGSDHSPDHTVEEVEPSVRITLTPPHSPHPKAPSPTQELDHVHSRQSSQESPDSVFVEEDEQDINKPSFQTTEQELGMHISTQYRPISSTSSPDGYAEEDANSLPFDHKVALSGCSPHSTSSAPESSVTTTPPHSGVKKDRPPHGSSESEQERETKVREQKVTSRKVKDDTSWIGRKNIWSGSPSHGRSRPSSDSVDRPISLETNPTSVSNASDEDYLPAANSQSSSQGPCEYSGNEVDSPPKIRPWRSNDRLTVSVNESQFSRTKVRSRSFGSSTLNRVEGKAASFTTSSTLPRSSADTLKDATKKSGKEKKPKGVGRKWTSFKIKGRLEKMINPLKRSKSTFGSSGPASPDDHSTGDQEHEESSEDDESRDERFPKLRPVPRPRPVSIIDYTPDYPELFQYVFLVGLKEDHSKTLATYIIQKFPPQISKEDSKDDAIKSVHQFCFPDLEHWKPVSNYESETYSFVLTSMEGNKRFGYCRRLLPEGTGERLPEVYCIISPHGCFDLYSKVLDHVEQRRAVSRAAVFTLLKSLIANPFPAPGRTVSIPVIPAKSGDLEALKLTRSPDSRLEHVNFGELYNTLSPKRIIQVFSSLLLERRVVLSAQRLSTLSSCCHALLALLYPFEWQYTFIPVLPSSLIDFCCSPVPFIMGINPRMAKQLDHLELPMEEALVIDLDKGKFLRRIGDESSILPRKLFKYLQHELESADVQLVYKRASVTSNSSSVADDIVVNAFMTVFAYLYGNYKEFFAPDLQTGGKVFQREKFVHSFESESEQRFLKEFQCTQMFDMFMHFREDPVKAETVSQGHFEKKLPKLKERFPLIEQCNVKKSRFHMQRKAAPNKT